jgi:hypothetical protein
LTLHTARFGLNHDADGVDAIGQQRHCSAVLNCPSHTTAVIVRRLYGDDMPSITYMCSKQ